MSRRSKATRTAPPAGHQRLLWTDAAVLAGLEPVLPYEDVPRKTRTKQKKAFKMANWAYPFLCPDGLVWTYIGHGEWQAYPPTYYRTQYQFEWLQQESHYNGERKRLIEWLDIERHKAMREKQDAG